MGVARWTAVAASRASSRSWQLLKETCVAAFIGTIQAALTLALSISGFALVRRRAGHTRWQLVGWAVIGGGLAGALTGSIAAAGGASVADALPFAVLGLGTGLIVGLAGVAALALGRLLGREP